MTILLKDAGRKTGHGFFVSRDFYLISICTSREFFFSVFFNEIVNLFTQVMMDHGATNEFVKVTTNDWKAQEVKPPRLLNNFKNNL